MRFLGVTTSRSSIQALFPRWVRALGLPAARLIGQDLPLGSPPETYRAAVADLVADPHTCGALITSHKTGVHAAAADLFDELDDYARLCGEISLITKREGRLLGAARDVVTAARALRELLPPSHFARTGGHALCLGAGGAGLAIAVLLLERHADRPERLVVTDVVPERLRRVRDVAAILGAPVDARCAPSGDDLLAGLPDGSLVVNATGMGKDRPGSPIGDAALFPRRAVVWELNYRGPLDFLRQARRQAARRGLRVADGWRYFLHGWTDHIGGVFGITIGEETFARLDTIAHTSGES
ncbi:shikimate dehydrogenase [Nonomuraea longispora]|uniref:Shikimate dehydrogenase n=2 Tax=Nonomuraea longispora TaxID=1848320 RepID=A0A4V2XKP5_9ACTN|nr:shikimate dehydrogenase [Nonomuraea longispora]